MRVPAHSAPTLSEISDAVRARESALARLLMAFISTGLLFMLLPGTFLGVWNLLQISGRESVASVSSAWLQAHGHAQVFGWIGSFMLGIGFYSVPKFCAVSRPRFGSAWACWLLWTTGVTLRWAANVYNWYWRALLTLSASLELIAFIIFLSAVSRHRPEPSGKSRLEPWVIVVITGCMGLLSALLLNFGAALNLALHDSAPALPHGFDQRFLTLLSWGFLVPFVWGFSAKWMPVFLGLQPFRPALLFFALAADFTGIILAFSGKLAHAAAFFVAGVVLAIAALRMFESAVHQPKTRGVHPTFPYFVRAGYVWLLVAAVLGVAAALWDTSGGIWGASRHALTVGFIAVMVLSVGPRILPAFAGMRPLWSTRLMFAGLALLFIGCLLRVPAEILAYQRYADWAWPVLPVSALLELAGIAAFACNIACTFVFGQPHARKLAPEALTVSTQFPQKLGHGSPRADAT